MDWKAEIEEQHALLDTWFRDGEGAFDRFEAAVDPGFTIISPSGDRATAPEIIEVVRSGRRRAPEQTIVTTDHELLAEDAELVVARYVEHHRTRTVSTARWSTVVFRRDPSAPNGVRWLTVHETWRTMPDRRAPSRP